MLALLSGIHQVALDATDTDGNVSYLLTNPLPKIWEVGMNVFTHIKIPCLKLKVCSTPLHQMPWGGKLS